jgi:hypothetical protein
VSFSSDLERSQAIYPIRYLVHILKKLYIVCNGYPNGKAAEVWAFNTKAVSWLKENVSSGRWAGKAVQVPIHEVANIVAKHRPQDYK